MDFYEEYTINLSDEQQEKFFAENPDFLSGYSIDRNKIKLLRDPIYIGLMRKIKNMRKAKINRNIVLIFLTFIGFSVLGTEQKFRSCFGIIVDAISYKCS